MELRQQIVVNVIFYELKNTLNQTLCLKIISYLDSNDLKTINQVMLRTQQHTNFSQLLKTYFFLCNYLNRTDRSLYSSFYEQHAFQKIQHQHLISLSQSYSKYFQPYPEQYKQIFNFIKLLLPAFVNRQELVEELERMLFDPDLPLPRLKRQNQGIFCKTSFQNFLISLKSKRNDFDYLPESFENLKEYFETQEEKYLGKIFIKSNKDKILNTKVRSLRFTPFQITYEGMETFLCEKSSLHNFLVGIYTLSDIWLTATKEYLCSLNDPFHRYVQLITRYGIYRNFVISIQQNLYFAFEQYDELFCEVFGDGKPKYRFWRSAMTKWLKKMEEFHPECQQVYFYCLTKLRMQNLLTKLEEKEKEEPEKYMQFLSDIGFRSVRNQLNLRQYELEVNQSIYKNQSSNEVQNFFQNNWEQYEAIAIEYFEYLIDLSVNEQTVHWCGHSQQPLSEPYELFQKQFLCHNKSFLMYLNQCRKQHIEKKQFMKWAFQSQENFFNKIQIKPVLLRSMIEDYNQVIQIQPEQILTEEIMLQVNHEPITHDFQTNDELLNYFNSKANIKFNLQEEELYFYSINPLISAKEMLYKSVSTTMSSNIHEDDENESNSLEDYISYISQEGEESVSDVQQYQQRKQKSKKRSEDMWLQVQGDEQEKQMESELNGQNEICMYQSEDENEEVKVAEKEEKEGEEQWKYTDQLT